ncbi:MAG: hypothetical protein K2X81_01465 [Candidatus Obscuribacterales bacterium]|nr:hypothetical protein [Candidatus Obscuribacterales bacterium]
MNDTQLTSAFERSERDEPNNNAIVETFTELAPDAHFEMPSTVQVTLAKRIVMAGSDRVLCLGARTSVPINDDERASVSDLTLRLSDGTNVALSLSFFDDEIGSIVPLNRIPVNNVSMGRVTFEPFRYSAKDESKLGMVLVSMTIVAMVGVYFAFPGLADKLIDVPTVNKLAMTYFGNSAGQATLKHSSPKPQSETIQASNLKHQKHERQKTALTASMPSQQRLHSATKLPTFKKSFGNESDRSTNSTAKTIEPHGKKAHSKQSNMMFVPPPPPTEYAMPPANSPYWTQFAPMINRAASANAVQAAAEAPRANQSNSSAISSAPVKMSAPNQIVRKAPSPPKPEDNFSAKSNEHSNNEHSNNTILPLTHSSAGEHTKADTTISTQNESTTNLEPSWKSTNGTAPVPGNNADTIMLERIIPPDSSTSSLH